MVLVRLGNSAIAGVVPEAKVGYNVLGQWLLGGLDWYHQYQVGRASGRSGWGSSQRWA